MENSSIPQHKGENDIVLFLFRWRVPLMIITIVTILLSILFSSPLFITPLYKSTVILYPASSNAISKALLNINPTPEQDILQFGEDAQTEQMLQILNSNTIRDKVISSYKLAEHYGIKNNSKYFYTRLYNRFKSNVTFKRTEYMAVKISVLDKDPQMAADIANGIAAILDSVKIDMQRQRALQGLKIVESAYQAMQAEILTMEDSLTKLRILGVHDYETQAEMINQQLAIEIAKGNTRAIKALDDKLQVLAKYGGPYVSLRDALEYKQEQLSIIKAKYEDARIDATEVLPQKFVVENAYKSERKAYPIVWVIVVLSTLSTLFFSILVIAGIEKWPALLSRFNQYQKLRS